MFARHTRRRRALRLLGAAAALLALMLPAAAVWRRARAPRVWRPGETAVAFWSWRTEAPTQEEVERAADETGARTLFLRAGQFDLRSWRVERVRAVEGVMPRGVELHLVYNATPRLLAEFGRVNQSELSAAFVETFRMDSARAGRDGARVAGLQIDFDVPTRLLTRYGRVLRETRLALPGGVKLSVTGLPTWMESGELAAVLGEVDFWAPQFYGAEIPATADRAIPISSPRDIGRDVARARELGEPFYAGLAAYGHAIVYDARGRLVELRGDLDPARVASDANLELVGRRAFGGGGDRAGAAPPAGEWRYVFRARSDTVVDGLTLRAGEQIVLEVPGSGSLRAGVRGVREGAGDRLLGICLFRLPTRGDATTLGLKEIAAALQDREPEFSTRLSAGHFAEDGGEAAAGNLLVLTAENDGAGGAVYGAGALNISLRVPRGGVRGVTRLEGFDTFETLCEFDGALRPCGASRASVVRLGASAWPAGARARAALSFEGGPPAALQASVAARRDDGRVWERDVSVSVRGAEKR